MFRRMFWKSAREIPQRRVDDVFGVSAKRCDGRRGRCEERVVLYRMRERRG